MEFPEPMPPARPCAATGSPASPAHNAFRPTGTAREEHPRSPTEGRAGPSSVTWLMTTILVAFPSIDQT